MLRHALLTASLAYAACLPACDAPPRAGGWEHWGSDLAASHYAPLPTLDAASFERLRPAWTWESADVRWLRDVYPNVASDRRGAPPQIANFQVTPVVADGTLFGITSIGQVFALDAITGKEHWLFDPKSYLDDAGAWRFGRIPKHRGVSLWRDDGALRVIATTIDGRLLALDARTGAPVAGFGENGRVDLLDGLRRDDVVRVLGYFQAAPATVVDDVIVVGSSINDRPSSPRGVPGDVRGYDARTGERLWTFHTIPTAGEPGHETWEDRSNEESGAANAWAVISADPRLGLVYLATSTPTSDFYGGHRLGDNLFAESLVALDYRTGALAWHHQIIRHGLWDYDLPATPNLVDLSVDGRDVAAVALVTKQGWVFVYDRKTGEPVWPIEERPVPASDVPGERAAATQPAPTKPPPFDLQGAFEEDLADYTPELHEAALRVFRRYRSGPIYTPPSLEGTLTLPGPPGGASWQGAGFDPETGVLFVPSVTGPKVISLERGTAQGRALDFVRSLKGLGFGSGTGLEVEFREGRLPLFKGPMSRITAFDLHRGRKLWQVATGPGVERHPLLADVDVPPLGSGARTCVLATKHLLIAGDGGDYFRPHAGEPILRAYDKTTGAIVGEVALPGKVMGCPMAYEADGRPWIVAAVSDPSKRKGGEPRLVALTPAS